MTQQVQRYESFTDLLDRLLGESTADWREGFGTLPDAEGDELERIVTQLRKLDEETG